MKFIIFDMDDTLLDGSRNVSLYTLNVLQKLQELGHKIVINTARSKFYNQRFFNLIKPDYAILNGGSLIIDKNEKIIFSLGIKDNIQNIVNDLICTSSTFSMQTLETLYSSDPNYKKQGARYYDFRSLGFNVPTYKIVASFYSEDDAKKIADKYQLNYSRYLNGDFYRFNELGCSKEEGVENLLKSLGYTNNDTICFGDDIGDIKMLQNSNHGVIMKNAAEEYKKLVKYETKYDNTQDGVARYLVQYFNLDI